MPNIITKKFNLENAKTFLDSFADTGRNSLYMFLAKPNSWGEPDLPPDPVDNLQEQSKIWDEMISLKRIVSSRISSVVRRINWSAQSIYSEYDHEDVELLSKDFYVLNREFNVYKCIDNFGGSRSTVEPTGRSLNIFSTSDGYKWKYMYNITSADRLKFLTANWMPVNKNAEVSAAAKDGAIENIKIYNGGLNYSFRAQVVVDGDGKNAVIPAKQSLGVIYDFTYTNNGTGYRFANAYITDTNSNGTGANIRAILSPVGGHGYDPVTELGANYVMLNVKTQYNEGYGDFPAGFTFRTVGVIKNPVDITGNVATAATLNSLAGIELSNINGTFNNYEFVEGANSKANVFAVSSNVNGGNGYIRFIQSTGLTSNYKPFNIGEVIVGKTTGTTAIVSNLLLSELRQDTGSIIYVENRNPVTRSSNQTDNLHLVIEF
jgi:hypothetical protein